MALGVFSSVILSIFLGLEASEELVDGVPIQNTVVNMFNAAGVLMINDLSLLIFGPKVLNLGLKKSHRDLIASQRQIRSFIKRKIHKISNETD